ncbi:hypothetical protein [Leptospira levettii]|uniref:hypothetical protein n=1 Tax=Leptospira levettii TaxID=2023178 RepID=UPI001FED5ECC|nr:hypothetical protein [Leptospira levettii]
MSISNVLSQIKKKPENFPRYFSVLREAAEKIQSRWLFMAGERAKLGVKAGGLGWWGVQYLSRGQVQIEQQGIGYKIFYSKGSGNYDVEKIAEDGRSAFDIVHSLLNNSKKVRISKGGKKYLIVPMASNESQADVVMKIIGSYKEESPNGGFVTRNKYSYTKLTDKKKGTKTFQFSQKQERGGSSSSNHNLIMVTSDSQWKPYPEIKGQKFSAKMQKVADQLLTSEPFLKALAEAIIIDLQENRIKLQKEKRK